MSEDPGLRPLQHSLRAQRGQARPTLRERLCRRLLEDLGITVDPQRIYPATGYYRTDIRADCMRWEAHGTRSPGYEVVQRGSSWDVRLGRADGHTGHGSTVHTTDSEESAYAWFAGVKQTVALGSWDTMTDCARYGVTLNDSDEVYAKKPDPKPAATGG